MGIIGNNNFRAVLPESYFITATDTEVGKTFITAELGEYFQNQGYTVGAMKPISSGGREDAVYLKKVMKLDDDLDLINPVWFEKPLAPVACQLDSQPVASRQLVSQEDSVRKIRDGFDALNSRYDLMLVEGIGGVLVPLWHNYYVADLIKEMALPVLIVARAGIGTLNHTLMTIESLHSRAINIAGVILNGLLGRDISEQTNRAIIEECSGINVLAELPFIDNFKARSV